MTSREFTPGFFVHGVTDGVWTEYCSWFDARGVSPPPFVSDSIFVAQPGILLAGCCIYPCDGPYAVVEYAATNPAAPMRLTRDAMLFGAAQLTTYGAMRKKTMLCFPSSRGMERLLSRVGFGFSSVPVMKRGPISATCYVKTELK